MRLSTDAARDDERAVATIRAALSHAALPAGAVVLDTARSYGLDDADAGHNERLVARAIVESGVDRSRVHVITKCGMRRPDGGWRPDGRATTILADARASHEALGGPADLLLLHAPDPKVPLATSVRALVRAAEAGHAKRIGLSNVSRGELEEALAIAPIAAVEVALGAYDDASARGGLVRLCGERGVEVYAHSPLGGPARAPRLAKDPRLVAAAAEVGVSPAELVLAYLAALPPNVVPLPGARRPETAASVIAAARLVLDERSLARLDARFPGLAALRRPAVRPPLASEARAEVVVLMGIAGAGKSRAAREWVARGYERLNRDERGGTLRGLAKILDERLAAGATRVVLDNTYTTRAPRADMIAVASTRGARVVCHHLEISAHEAQVNAVLRMLDRYGELLEPEALARHARKDPNLVTPGVQFRMLRELERPSLDEGFAEVVAVPFERVPRPGATTAGAMVAFEVVAEDEDGAPRLRAGAEQALAGLPVGAPCMLLAWRPDASVAWRERAALLASELAERAGRPVELGLCAHAAGPPICWCRPPLPGLWLAFAERRGLDPAKSVFVSASPSHAAMARALGLALRAP
jgi:aryl-alcohol dehydrogenase-like predicted oxidoreductase/predicted kinase